MGRDEYLRLVWADFDRVRADYVALIIDRRRIQRELSDSEQKLRRLKRVLAK